MAKRTVKQRVKLRETPTSENRISLYLDWSKNNKRNREFLNLIIYNKPKNKLESEHNAQTLIKAELLRADREKQFFSDELDEIKDFIKVKNQDFYVFFEEYVENYKKADLRVMKAVLKSFKAFAPPPLSTKQVDETLCNEYFEHLKKTMKGETPQTYFRRFKKFLAYSTKSKTKLFKTSPAIDIKVFKPEARIKKKILTIEELKLLTNTPCNNEEVKRAFLFACNTGLRLVDIIKLKWEHIEGDLLTIKQSKTGETVEVFLNNNAFKYLDTTKEKKGLVFDLKSTTSISKSLRLWVQKSGIEKHITFHCARHSFGTLLAYYKTDLLTISKLMGHSSTEYTQRYTRTADELKKEGVNSIPNI